jgi:copper ion binding protein
MKNTKDKRIINNKQNSNKIFWLYLALPFLLLLLFKALNAEPTSVYMNKTVEISLPTIVCNQCVTRIDKALKKVDGVIDYKVNLENKNVSVTFDDEVTSLDNIESAITKAGYDANDKKADRDAFDNLPGCCKAK